MKTIEEFREYYSGALIPGLKEFEDRRLIIVKKVKKALFIAAAAGAASAAGLFIVFSHPAAIIAPLILAAIGAAIAYSRLTGRFILDFKNQVIGKIVRFFDENLSYNPEEKITKEQFLSSSIYSQRVDRYKGEDKVEGVIEKTRIEFSEIHAEYKTVSRDSKGRRKTNWHTIFRGLFFIADFNKDFIGSTVILPDFAERFFGNFIGKSLQSLNSKVSKKELINLEDPEFEKLFAVYGTDQIEARYILTPALMKRIVDFTKKSGNGIALSFINSNVNIAISTVKNMFEPKIFRTLLDPAMTEEYFFDLETALSIVDELNLNTRIWTKE